MSQAEYRQLDDKDVKTFEEISEVKAVTRMKDAPAGGSLFYRGVSTK